MRKIYQHKLNKSDIPSCEILGVNIAAINMEWLIDFTCKNIKALSGDYMCVANVHTTVMAYEDAAYRLVQNSGILAIPDGGPLSSLGRKKGFSEMRRTTGPSYMQEILKLSPKPENNNCTIGKKYKHFFYGSSPETLKKLQHVIKEQYSNAEIVGMISPPFRPLTKAEDAEITEKINRSKPDFIWVGLGAPKQEIWMSEHQGKVNGFMVGVGAGFDYLAGNIKRAPKWLQDHNLEWLYRMIQEPKRLFMRYMKTNTKFIWLTWIMGK